MEPNENSEILKRAKRQKFLIFRMDKELYGIPLAEVKEVLELPQITPLPEVQKHIKGIINIRGRVITIMNLKERMQLNEKTNTQRPCVIIMEDDEGKVMGGMVDEIILVAGFDPEEIQNKVSVQSEVASEYIDGVVKPNETQQKLKDTMIILLNMKNILWDRKEDKEENINSKNQMAI